MSTNLISLTHEQFGQFRIIRDENTGEPWFVAKEVIAALGLGNVTEALRALDDDERGSEFLNTLGGRQKMIIISEPGFYTLAARSSKPEAKAFSRWVRHDVLPSIRKTGGYIVDRPDDTPPSRLSLKVHLLLQATVYRKMRASHVPKPSNQIFLTLFPKGNRA